jgi:hypothetical protein
MKVDVIPFSTFESIVESESNRLFGKLVGTQCIYPVEFQTPILNTFLKNPIKSIRDKPKKYLRINLNSNYNTDSKTDSKSESEDESESKFEDDTESEHNLSYCFKINEVCFYPKYTYSDPNITIPLIIISDYFYEKYFDSNSTDHILHIIYNIPYVKMIRLKRTDGDFPKDDSIEYLLTDYFESCSIVNLGQEFKLDLYDDSTIKFEVDDITYKTEFKKNINHRIEEIELMIQFNTSIAGQYNSVKQPNGLSECESTLTNFEWHYHTLGKKIPSLGYLVNNEVEIDFVVSEAPQTVFSFQPSIQIPYKQNLPNMLNLPNLPNLPNLLNQPDQSTGRSLVEDIPKDHVPEVISHDEIRKRRLAYYDKLKKNEQIN